MMLHNGDGSFQTAASTLVDDAGNVYLPDGSIIAPDGTLMQPDGLTLDPEGNVIDLPTRADAQAVVSAPAPKPALPAAALIALALGSLLVLKG